jgi:hypothetical protein
MRMTRFWRQARWLALGLAGLVVLAACTGTTFKAPIAPTGTDASTVQGQLESTGAPTAAVDSPTTTDPPEPDYDIVTLLPPDAIPAVDDPQFYDVLGAELEYEPDELVLGVELNGDARAYPIDLLAQHEIVNDMVGGQSIAVTY